MIWLFKMTNTRRWFHERIKKKKMYKQAMTEYTRLQFDWMKKSVSL